MNGRYEYLTDAKEYQGFLPYDWYKIIGSFFLDGENGDNGLIALFTVVGFGAIGFALILTTKPASFILTTVTAIIIAIFCLLFAIY